MSPALTPLKLACSSTAPRYTPYGFSGTTIHLYRLLSGEYLGPRVIFGLLSTGVCPKPCIISVFNTRFGTGICFTPKSVDIWYGPSVLSAQVLVEWVSESVLGFTEKNYYITQGCQR